MSPSADETLNICKPISFGYKLLKQREIFRAYKSKTSLVNKLNRSQKSHLIIGKSSKNFFQVEKRSVLYISDPPLSKEKADSVLS